MTESTTPMGDTLVERRLRYLERQKALRSQAAQQDPGQVLGSGPANRHGMPRVPVGQRVVPNWPVLDLGDLPEISLADWRLEIGGLVDNPVTLDWTAFLALPQVEDESDFHCVTTWSRLDNHWTGVRFQTLAELVVPRPDVTTVVCTGYDHMPGSRIPYTTNLPLARAVEDDVLLVHAWEGQPLPAAHGGPCRMITPKLYAWKGTKWIRRIEFRDRDQPGFWEARGYSNTAEPWQDDRFSR
ncbi:MAG: molybdopterin-dependent oxidoreductase [Acidobacteria bacterium]|nr:molybdopterin-dependent oxidoreductase [Acidobacteriota bacterium]